MKWLKFNKASGYDLIPIDDVIYVKGTDRVDATPADAFVEVVHEENAGVHAHFRQQPVLVVRLDLWGWLSETAAAGGWWSSKQQ